MQCSALKEQISDLTNLMYFYKEAGFKVDERLMTLFGECAPTYDLALLQSVELMKFTKVYLSNEKCKQKCDSLIQSHIQRMAELPYD